MKKDVFTNFLESAQAQLHARTHREVKGLDAIFDDDLWSLLESHGLLERLDAGELKCAITGEPLCRENLGGLVMGEDGKLLLISDSADPISSPQSKLKF